MLTEGIIDFIRGLEGTPVAAVVRDKPDGQRRARARSACARPTAPIDVSEIARKHGRRRPPPRRRLLDRPQLRRARRVPLRRDPRSSTERLDCRSRAASCSSTSRPGSPRTTWSPGPPRARRQRSATPARSIPFATGLLIVILLGRATRLQRYVLGLPKTYLATARLGWRSTTGDPDGELTETGEHPGAISSCRPGRSPRRVPMTSAVKVDGERLYRKARAGRGGRATEPRGRDLRAELLEHDVERASHFEIRCSAGTYIRTLVEELGDAYCERLRRTAIGDLRLVEGRRRAARAGRAARRIPARARARRGRGQAGHARDPQRMPEAGRRCRGPAAADPRGPADRRRPARPTACCGPTSSSHEPESGADDIKVTSLPDAEPRPRQVAIGTFDGVHVGHRAVIDGADTVLTFDPHPRPGDPPRGGAEADHAVRGQARRDRRPRRRRSSS